MIDSSANTPLLHSFETETLDQDAGVEESKAPGFNQEEKKILAVTKVGALVGALTGLSLIFLLT
jgi:hypothetical protein